MKKLLALILLVMIGLTSWAQSTPVKGVVLDKDSKEPLAYCVVVWKSTRAGTVADENGRFSIGRIPTQDTLKVSFIGFEDAFVVVKNNVDLTILLKGLDMKRLDIQDHQGTQHMHGKDPQLFQTVTEKELCKAACCNLSESFETNASVDASYTDGITGTRQIKMLGLDGKYAQLMGDNIPNMRGLNTVYGLGWVPGPWIREIAISKGAGSVLPGYESIAGQINVAHKGPEMKEKFFLNAYAGNQGRYELNTVSRHEAGEHFHWDWMTHYAKNNGRFDMNHDGFLDNPVGDEYNGRLHAAIENHDGFRGDYAVQGLQYLNQAGTSGHLDIPNVVMNNNQWKWNVDAKNGWVFEPDAADENEQSIGTQVSFSQQLSKWNWEGVKNYSGRQQTLRLVFLHAIQMTEHAKLTYGWNFLDDQYKEYFSPMGSWDRHERVQGGMAEWAWNHHDEIQIIAGARAEWHNLFGFLLTPRLHTRFTLAEGLHLKWMTGLGRRTANVIMDQPGFLASSRVMNIQGISNQPQYPLGLPMEEAWNKGVVLSYDTKLFYRKAGITLDAFQTNFKQQVVMDWDQSGLLKVYPLQGKSVSTTAQAEAFFSPLKRFEIRMAYRWVENMVDYSDGRRSLPFVSKNRFFTNLSYSTKMFEGDKRWLFDLTAKWNDGQRLPNLLGSQWEGQQPEVSPAFWMINGQVSLAREERWDVYLGVENLFNFKQNRMVLYSDGSDGTMNLDANFAYAPAFGRMSYVGLRWRLAE